MAARPSQLPARRLAQRPPETLAAQWCRPRHLLNPDASYPGVAIGVVLDPFVAAAGAPERMACGGLPYQLRFLPLGWLTFPGFLGVEGSPWG
jgi:hypothetical protein